MELYVLRHGKAEAFPSPGGEDADRPLTRQGRDEMQRIASWMLRNQCHFDLIATSPLRRAEETADIIAEVYNLEKKLVVWEDLSPGMDFDRLMEQIVSCDDLSSLLMIGHEPSLSGCIGRIISAGGGQRSRSRREVWPGSGISALIRSQAPWYGSFHHGTCGSDRSG